MVCRVITESAYIVSQASAQGAVELYIYVILNLPKVVSALIYSPYIRLYACRIPGDDLLCTIYMLVFII